MRVEEEKGVVSWAFTDVRGDGEVGEQSSTTRTEILRTVLFFLGFRSQVRNQPSNLPLFSPLFTRDSGLV